MKSLRDKVVLITGASSGIGWETSLAFAKKGAKVVAVARNVAKLKELQALLSDKPDSHLIFPADINTKPMMQILISAIQEKYGGLDILIHNAAIGYLAPLEKMKMEVLRQVFETNYFSLLQLTQMALPMLKKSKGHLINISSVIGRVAVPHYEAYCSSKFALEGLSQALRPELAPHGIKVSVVCPGLTETNFSQNSFRESPPQTKWTHRQAASVVAMKIVRVAEKPRRELILTLGGKFLLFLNRFFPRFLEWVFEKQLCRS